MFSIGLEVSSATIRNWQKLNVTQQKDKLTRRANKTSSTKNIIPKEYFSNCKNIEKVQSIVTSLLLYNLDVETLIKNLIVNLLISKGFATYDNGEFECVQNNVKQLINSLNILPSNQILNLQLPQDEIDILGIIYQCLLTEGDKNKKGSYYTPKNIIHTLTKDLVLQDNQKILDPCCGTGSFLLNYNVQPSSIYGFDIDPIAIIIAKTNLIIKYKGIDFIPQIYKCDFLTIGEGADLSIENQFANMKFDYIITNPPWGNKNSKGYIKYFNQIQSKEISSYFIVKASQLLNKKGIAKFVLPESILNVSVHKDIREYVLSNMHLKTINIFGRCFSNVVSKVVALSFDKNYKEKTVAIESEKEKYYVDICNFSKNFNYTFILSDSKKLNLLKKIYTLPFLTLTNSVWGLGIVTGDNKNKLFCKKDKNMSPILTGKEVGPYINKKPLYYFNFDKNDLQQTAKKEIYFAKEKLIYKFISSKLVFSYDDKQLCVLNSANILIPKIKGMSIKTVLAYLNSDVLQFVYKETFNQIKVLKNNLCKLPFPLISENTNKKIENLVAQRLNGVDTEKEIQTIIDETYNLTNEDKKIIRGQ